MPLNTLKNIGYYLKDSATNLFTGESSKYDIHVVTGDKRGAGTDSNIFILIHDEKGKTSSVIKTNSIFKDDHERASTTSSQVPDSDYLEHPFKSVEVWRDNFGNIPNMFGKISEFLYGGKNKKGSAAWYLERIEIEEISTETKWVFPVQRWIESDKHYYITLYDCLLPCQDPRPGLRLHELTKKRDEYRYIQKPPGGPAQIADLPSDEQFSEQYFWTFASEKVKLIGQCKFINATSPKWKSLADLSSVYKHSLGEPDCLTVWREDWWFGTQRIQGVNPVIIQLCKEIPDKLNVTEETVGCFLEGLSLEEALETNKIFICDLEILEGINCPENRILATPIALFYLNKENKLMPIAIQLFQQKGDDNPVYTPNDSENTWLVAKMYYNNCEAQHHQALTHLGLTHLLMEGVCICTNRNLSPSHPMFKLMAPHFLYLLAINSRGLEKLVNPGGWVDCCMTQGVQGIFQLMIKGFDTWHYDTHSTPEKSLRHRGVLDENILPYYPYREDALPLHRAIENYVTKIVYHYYDSPDKIENDLELRMWRLELARERDNCGVGLKGLPGCDETGFHDAQEIIDVVAFIISTCSLGHAASNFQQYEQYGFVPNYAGLLTKDPPREKKEYTETDIMALLPNKEKTLDIMVITKLLSLRGTKSLGDFEMQYLYHPQDVQAAEEFRNELKELHEQLELKEQKRFWKFPYLDPMLVPNSISV